MTMMTPAPHPDPIPSLPSDAKVAGLIVELNNMRDALVQLALVVRDYLSEADSTLRDQAVCEADQAIDRAKAFASHPHRRP